MVLTSIKALGNDFKYKRMLTIATKDVYIEMIARLKEFVSRLWIYLHLYSELININLLFEFYFDEKYNLSKVRIHKMNFKVKRI